MPQIAFPRLTPAVRWILIGLAAVHLVTFALFLVSDAAYARMTDPLQLDPQAWIDDLPIVPLWQLATYGMLHSPVDVMHLLGNLLMLYFFGTMLEEELGTRRFLWTYAGAQVAGALVFLVACWLGMRSGPAVGASGACYGLMIAVATLFPSRVVYLLFVPIALRWMALLILVITVFSALVQMKLGASGTAHLVHFGGIAYGFLAVRTGLVRKDPVEILERRRAVNEVERAQSDAMRVDQLLDKISREGIGSLSKGEREFLKKASSRK
ncbi:MAG: rhomboid family intramembrane serine protease [Planctomycetota bacterium]|nr:rhomboid family intramembrane serine protease [Planctomycetota bacterium]